MAGARGIEPRSKVLETFILAVILYPYSVLRYYTKPHTSLLLPVLALSFLLDAYRTVETLVGDSIGIARHWR